MRGALCFTHAHLAHSTSSKRFLLRLLEQRDNCVELHMTPLKTGACLIHVKHQRAGVNLCPKKTKENCRIVCFFILVKGRGQEEKSFFRDVLSALRPPPSPPPPLTYDNLVSCYN